MSSPEKGMDGESGRHDMLESILHNHSSEPRNLPLEYLRKITNDFNDKQLLGEGGFGKVYKGLLQNENLVAVKKLDQLKPGVQEKQFENEVYHLMRLKHPNIVRFLGYCYETKNECLDFNGKYIFAEMQQRLLCLEYLSNGSLDEHLSDESSGFDWDTRYKIIKGVCCGIHYLHEECKFQTNGSIIHLDLKPANILLDDNMVPKVADFGLSRHFDDKKTQTRTTNLAGSLGYMAPEYIYSHVITTKADIYSLGAIIIEIITGKRIDPFSFNTVTSYQDFVEAVLKNWSNRLKEAPSETDCKQIKCCLEIGLSCVKVNRNERPSTKEIIDSLNRGEGINCYVNNEEMQPADKTRKTGNNQKFVPGRKRVLGSYRCPAATSGWKNISIFYKIISDLKDLLEITPLELRFCLELNKRIPYLVQLTNKTDHYVAFNFGVLRTTSLYYIEPPSGFMRPRSTSNVTVTMEERPVVPQDWQCYDEFLVQSVVVKGNCLMSEHNTGHIFSKTPSDIVNQVKLTVVYVQSPLLPSSSGLNDIHYKEENVDILIINVCQDLGFSNGRPIAAVVIYRCLLHWKSFESERTVVFDRIIQSVSSVTEDQDSNDKLAYWLSNSSILLVLLQRTLKPSAVVGSIPRRRKPSTSLFGRMSAMSIQSSPQSTGTGGASNSPQRGAMENYTEQVGTGSQLGRTPLLSTGGPYIKAKYPALLFKQQLTACLGKLYGMIRDNFKKEMVPLLRLCIQAPASLIKGSRSQANALSQQTLLGHWQNIVKILTNYLNASKENYIPSFLTSKAFTQIFSFINVQLFNSLLLRRECCSISYGEYVKAGLVELEQWCHESEQYAGCSWDELAHIRQAVGFLVIHEKQKFTLKEITNDLCPVLSIQQLYRISTMYWDDKYGTHSVSSDVISGMRIRITEESNNAVSSSFLLDDDSSIPFVVDDISLSVPEFKVTDVDIPPSILERWGLAS